MTKLSKKEIIDLKKAISKANKAYRLGEAIITDGEYDAMVKRLEENGEHVPVGIAIESNTVEHVYPVLSLEKTQDMDELIKALEPLHDTIAEVKLDGITLVLVYENGKLIRATTRGDGHKGENVLDHVKEIDSIPKELPEHDIVKNNDVIVVTGECIMSIESFNKLNEFNSYSNPRNTVAGIMNRKTILPDIKELRFFMFDINCEDTIVNTQEELMEIGMKLGFKYANEICDVPRYGDPSRIFGNVTPLVIDAVTDIRSKLSFEIDGIVFKTNSLSLKKELGNRTRTYRHAFVYKFPNKGTEAFLEDVEFSIGKFGAISPVAILKPVEIDGVTITRCTLHNEDMIKARGIQKNQWVNLERANDVIPFISGVADRPSPLATPIEFPSMCPSCGEPISNNTCYNYNCEERAIKRLIHAVTKKALDIKGLGEQHIRTLYRRGLVKNVSDLVKLDTDNNVAVLYEALGLAVTDKVVAQIEDIKNEYDIRKVVYSLCIEGIGSTIANKITTSESLERAVEEIMDYNKTTKRGVSEFLENGGKDIIDELDANIDFIELQEPTDKLKGLSIAVTGNSAEGLSRDQLKELIRTNGGKVSGNVLKADYVVANSETTKTKKAKANGTPILTTIEFLNKFGLK